MDLKGIENEDILKEHNKNLKIKKISGFIICICLLLEKNIFYTLEFILSFYTLTSKSISFYTLKSIIS